MQLAADRFAVHDDGRAVDLATGTRVVLIVGEIQTAAEQLAWSVRCDLFQRLRHQAIAPLIDYGLLGRTERFEAWQARWYDGTRPLAARLFLKRQGEETVVHDTRSGQAVEHRLDDFELRVLGRLEQPKLPQSLATELASPLADIAAALARLAARGLLFAERGRYLSLVLPQEPPPMTFERLAPHMREAMPADDGGTPEPALVRLPRRAAPRGPGRAGLTV